MSVPSRPALFRLAARKRAVVKRAQLAQDSLVTSFSAEILAALHAEAQRALEAGQAGEKHPEINLAEVDRIAYRFLLATVRAGFSWARHQRDADLPRPQGSILKRMAKAPKAELPPEAQSLPQLFRNRKAWDVMVKRNRLYSQGIKRAYMQKLGRHFAKTMPRLLGGEITIQEAKINLEKAVKATGPRVQTIFRTETTKYFTEAQINFFEGEPGILGMMFDSVSDAARTKICSSRAGMVLKMDTPMLAKNKPPCHFNCRSHLIPIADTPENRKLFSEPSRQPENRQLVPLPKGWRAA